MPIREKVRRAMRRSAPSPTTISPTPSTSTSASASNPPDSKFTSRFANLSLTRRNRSSGSKSNSSSGSGKRAPAEAPDPREKPFTETNLRYQAMFGEYEMRFGASRRLSADWEIEGVSPTSSRRNSLCEER